MKQIIKSIIWAIAALFFTVAANAQTDNSKIEKVVLDKMGDTKSIEYSIKPDETKDVLIVEVKLGATLLIKSSQQGIPQAKTEGSNPNVGGGQTVSSGNNTGGGAMGNIITSTSSVTGAPPDVSQAYANAEKVVVPAKTNWILKKDGRQIGAGADGFEFARLAGRPVPVKNDPDTVPIFEPGTYVIAIKCIQKTACDDKLSLTLTPGALPDPANLGP